MDYYLDIQVQPDPEVSGAVLMNNLFAKFHRTMPQTVPGEVAISFPKYQQSLGDIIRFHGSETSLNKLMAQPWLKGLRDYTEVTDIRAVPTDVKGYRTMYRVQKKSANNRRKRSIAKGWLSAEEALQRIPDTSQQILKLPFLQFKSLSTGQTMRIFVALGELASEPTIGDVNSYGLSRTATVPWF